MQKIPCEFCGKPCAKGGALQSHIHFRHLGEVLEKFRNQLVLQHFSVWYDLQPKQLKEAN